MPSDIPAGTPRRPDSPGLVHHQMALRPPNHRSENGALEVFGLASGSGRSGAVLARHCDPGSAENHISDFNIDKRVVKYCVGTGTGLGKVKNRKTTLARLKALLSDPLVDTSVTFAEYMALDQDAKLVKKRAPGNWLAAHFEDGRRKLDHQLFRSMISFDLDYITVEQLEHIRDGGAEINRFYWFMHTTRAHCPEKPRVRMVVLTSRDMNAGETHAITRLLSLHLADDPDEAIEIPDLISFRYNQTMFLPSISKGQEFWTDESASEEILDVDAFLADHPGWDDFSQLPYQEAEKQCGVVDPSRRMENPREKKGIIGAWCRTYTVDEVIAEFLSDVYAPGGSSTETRYTYLGGTGSNGAVSYDDGLFLHSNHGTDPIEGSANAWDLMRIHKFQHLDDKSPANTSPGNLPSFKAMVKFAEADEDVAAERLAAIVPGDWDAADDEDKPGEASARGKPEAGTSIDDLLGPAPDEDEDEEKPKKKKRDWRAALVLDKQDALEKSLHNCATIIKNDPKVAPCIALNELEGGTYARAKLDFPKANLKQAEVDSQNGGRRWVDNDTAALMCALAAPKKMGGYDTSFARQDVELALLQAAEQNRYNPFLDKITKIEWDGVPRLATFFHDWFGAIDVNERSKVTRHERSKVTHPV